jgi:hypothetical protein
MSDPRRPDGSEPTEQMGNWYPPYPDPAYASQYTYPSYVPPAASNPTEPLPPYWQQGSYYPPGGPPQEPPPPPGPPKSPRWLWIVAALAVLLVVGLVIALVIADSSSKQSMVEPLPPMQESSPSAPVPTTTMSRTPTPTTTPSTTASAAPPTETTTNPGDTEAVVYNVTGEGRAINITYVDTGGVMQTEFNVVLPWSKEVTLSKPAHDSASVAIVNVGRDVTCTVSVSGVQIRQRTGAGLTICSGVG